jgi:hypothetical protein
MDYVGVSCCHRSCHCYAVPCSQRQCPHRCPVPTWNTSCTILDLIECERNSLAYCNSQKRLTPQVYAAEVAPLCLRPFLTSATTIGWSGGGMLSTGVLRGLLNSGVHNSYRIAFAVQWVWLLPMFAIVWLAPESPMWCVKTGRTDRARAALHRLGYEGETEDEVENRLALIEYTDSLEKHHAASTSYLECFKGDNLRRTEIACMVYSCTNLDGYDIAGSTSYFFQRAGLSVSRPTHSSSLVQSPVRPGLTLNRLNRLSTWVSALMESPSSSPCSHGGQ